VAFMGPLVGFWLKPGRSVGRVDGIIETCKIVTIILKIHPRPCGTRINKQTNIRWECLTYSDWKCLTYSNWTCLTYSVGPVIIFEQPFLHLMRREVVEVCACVGWGWGVGVGSGWVGGGGGGGQV
jgi:hypothetical protein